MENDNATETRSDSEHGRRDDSDEIASRRPVEDSDAETEETSHEETSCEFCAQAYDATKACPTCVHVKA